MSGVIVMPRQIKASDGYHGAAQAIITAIEEEFPVVRPKRKKTETVTALVNIMKHFLETKPKTTPQVKPEVRTTRR